MKGFKIIIDYTEISHKTIRQSGGKEFLTYLQLCTDLLKYLNKMSNSIPIVDYQYHCV